MKALVTGAGARVGRAIAIGLAKQGHDVAVHYASSAGPAQEVVAECRAFGVKAEALQADLLDDAQVAALVPAAVAAIGGPLTCLVNNASIFEYDTLETASLEAWDRHMGSNLKAPLFLSQAFAEQAPKAMMDARGEPEAQALIVNLVDQRIRKLTPEFMTYTLAKMGLWAFTQTAARGLAPHVRVNAVAPGPTLRGGRQSENHFDAQRKATVLKRGSNPEEIVAAIVYLLSASAVTGQCINVDGGQHLGWQTPDIQGLE